MKIAIDARTYFLRSGIGRYCRSVCGALAKFAPDTEFVLLGSNRKTPEDFTALSENQRVIISQAGLNDADEENLHLAREINDIKPDAVWFPSYTVPPNLNTYCVATVHDLTVILTPEHHLEENVRYFNRAIGEAVERADMIVADSKSTKNDLINHFEDAFGKVEVCYLGVDPAFFDGDKSERRPELLNELGLIERSYVLYTGSLEPRKNIVTLIDAYARCDCQAETPLVIGGIVRWKSEAISEAITRYAGPGRIITTGYVEENDLPALMSAAGVFAFPSLYEGFGLPVAEAMAAGAPVIASNTSSLPEVVGDAGILIEPYDAHAIAGAMDNLLADRALLDDYVERGKRRARMFDWRNTARCVYGLLCEGEE